MRTALIVIFFILFLGMAWVLTYGLMGGFDKELTPTPTPTATATPTATQTPTHTPSITPTPTLEIPKMIIKYLDTISYTLIDKWGYTNTPDPGYIFLVLDLDIENQGYESIDVGSYCFDVVVNNIQYDSTYIGLEDSLNHVGLLDGGRLTGKVTFEVLQEVMSAGYQVRWDSLWEYNIEWVRQ